MALFSRSLRGNLRRSLESGELQRDDNLDGAADKSTETFQCDSLDLVELTMTDRTKGPTTKNGG
jgi:hypothetical protein